MKSPVRQSKVRSVKWDGPKKILLLCDGRELKSSISACVTEGDLVQTQGRRAWVKCRNGVAVLVPAYNRKETVFCGNLEIPLRVKEITCLDELEAVLELADLHYRGHAKHGRTVRLVACTSSPLLPRVLGYIEIATSFFMNKARYEVFNAPFKNGQISWAHWDQPTIRRYINLIVRVSRCVVYPEFRGLGLGKMLLAHAFDLARDHWQMAGLKPYFVEITADMLKFIPFAERAGMVYIGQTEGNLDRVSKDMIYLLKNYKRISEGEIVREDSGGIVDLQVGYVRKLRQIQKDSGLTKEELFQRLDAAGKKPTLRNLLFLRDLLRFPKPTYSIGLIPEAQDYLSSRIETLGLQSPRYRPAFSNQRLSEPICFVNFSLSYCSKVRLTARTQAVQQAFSLAPDALETKVLKGFSLKIDPGSTVLIYGPSGSGKTSLLNVLLKSCLPENLKHAGTLKLPPDYSVGVLEAIRSRRPLIELFGRGDIRRALYVLNVAGLSEAHLYLKRFDELSRGQQYRALIAKMLDCGANVWVADEFCANLDRVTANVVCENLRRHAAKVGATVIAAAPHFELFVHSLKPDCVVQLTSAWEYKVIAGSEFLRMVSDSQTHFVTGVNSAQLT